MAAKATHESIRKALASSSVLDPSMYTTYLQGSYRNSTNVYGTSDVDRPVESNPDRDFVDAILGRDGVRSTGEGGLAVLRVNEARWESARTGREVEVRWPGPSSQA